MRPSPACCIVWSTAAWLPQQPCLRSGAWYAVDPAGHADVGCASWNRSAMNEIPSYVDIF
ncbi:MAG TPA: hypothetical protein DEF43_13420 [Chloroflexus aurantiacus]|nr:MAG: hypothetical protein D6716_07005 [Chloroflexota bacterium]HBW68134.1 hypothetical protein [Chloroflexus aurantiacus]